MKIFIIIILIIVSIPVIMFFVGFVASWIIAIKANKLGYDGPRTSSGSLFFIISKITKLFKKNK